MWNLKFTIIPVIIGATVIVTRSLKKNLEAVPGKHWIDFITKDSYTWNITHNTESTAVWSLKPERWGSPLVQEKYQAEKACDKRHQYRIIIIIMANEICAMWIFLCDVWFTSEVLTEYFDSSQLRLIKCKMYAPSSPWTRQLSRYVPTVTGVLCDTNAVSGVTIKGTLIFIISSFRCWLHTVERGHVLPYYWPRNAEQPSHMIRWRSKCKL